LGVNREGRKEILPDKRFDRSESLETWKPAFLDMKNRGLTRIGLLVTDDVSGLTGLIRGLFPLADHQLGTVHWLRKARFHLEKEGDPFFLQRFKEILASPASMAREKFSALCAALEDQAPAWMRHLRERVDHDRAFTHDPDI
jgi:transposase-like protein